MPPEVILLVLVALGLTVYRYYRRWNPARRSWWTRTSTDLEVMSDDASGIAAIAFDLFSRGRSRRIEGIYEGTWQGADVRLFDFVCAEETDDVTAMAGYGGGTEVRYACATTAIMASLPPLSVTREGVVTRAADAAAINDVAFELEEFNRAFEVRCADHRFANDFLDQRMMRFLLATDRAFSFETRGRWLLVFARADPRPESFAMLDALKGFRDHVPSVVGGLYGPSGSG